jgi:hypothetical protein
MAGGGALGYAPAEYWDVALHAIAQRACHSGLL